MSVPSSKYLAIAASLIFIAATAFGWYAGTRGFNPYPAATTISHASTCTVSVGTCPGFRIASLNLTVKTAGDITSQQLILTVVATSGGQMSYVKVFLGNVPIGSVDGPFTTSPRAVALGVPTTIAIVGGASYKVTIEGVYVDPASGLVIGDYVQNLDVTAVRL